jgi:two-component system response regulator PhoP
MRILVIEDEPALQRQVRAELEAQGYAVEATGEGKEALYFASEYPFDAAVVDLGLPGMSGIDIIRRLRARGNRLPILVLTARGRWQDKVEGLESGADDYLTKPFQPEELLARLKALLRRAAATAQDVLRCGPVEIDFGAKAVRVNGCAPELTTYEYRLLEHSPANGGACCPRTSWPPTLPARRGRDSNTIEVFIGRLRRKLDPDGSLQPLETLRGRGYRFALSEGG